MIRRLKHVDPEGGNGKVVEVFGHRTYAYDFGYHGDVRIDIVHVLDVVLSGMVIVYPYQLEI